jgi:EAL domain-containing protein (putative c-di-GMP-specific phosphodiesterase class I)
MEEACRQAQAWQRALPAGAPVALSVNLSARQLTHPTFLADLERVLTQYRLAPGTLMLEITESVMMGDTEAVIDRLAEIRRLGVRLAIDDFGTGFSSLSHVQRFPIDRLKIDRSFVAGLGKVRNDTAIVRTITALAKSLELSVTAEGVETKEQVRQLQALGCEHGQGYLFARPEPADAVSARLGLAIPPKSGSSGTSGDDEAAA